MTGKPTAAPAYFPYKHDSMAVVMAAEALGAEPGAPLEQWLCGHARTPDNTAKIGKGRTRCRKCRNEYGRVWAAARYERERRSLARMVGEARA